MKAGINDLQKKEKLLSDKAEKAVLKPKLCDVPNAYMYQ